MGPFTGIQLILKAATEIVKRPRLVAVGMVPPFVVSLIYVLIAIVGGPALVDGVRQAVMPLSRILPEWAGGAVVALVMVAIFVAFSLIASVGFTTLTLATGSPIYEKISETIDREVLDLTPVPGESLGVAVMRSASQSAVTFICSLVIAFLSVVVGLLPVVGTLGAMVIGLGLGGMVVTTELLGGAFGRRGKPLLRQRFEAMKARPVETLSFAVPAQFVLSIPLVSVLAFPFFSAAATLLAHTLLTNTPPTTVTTKE